MREPTLSQAYEVLCLQLADGGRKEALLGDCVDRARKFAAPFFVDGKPPSIYFEFPLMGAPFLDITLLYGNHEPGARIDSPAAAGTGPLLDWFADVCKNESYEDVSYGFELDTKHAELPSAAVHFQPRVHAELVEPFFEVIGEPERAQLYLDLCKRMPDGWPLSFFGIFRGRPDAPLRVCGYLGEAVKTVCGNDPGELARVFDKIGFTAYDAPMLSQIAELMATAPGELDFQLDVLPDGRLGDMFALDVQFEIQQPGLVKGSFESGPASRVFGLLESWGVADGRWKLAADAAFARSIPTEAEDGEVKRYAFTLMPQWVKARWRERTLSPSKLYFLGKAGFLDKEDEAAQHGDSHQ